MPAQQLEIINVSVIQDNIISEMYSFTNKKEAEKKFVDTIRGLVTGISENDIKIALEEGYYDADLSSVCITHTMLKRRARKTKEEMAALND